MVVTLQRKQKRVAQSWLLTTHKKKGDKIMKTLRNMMAALMIMMVTMAANAQPMSVYSMRNNARFLTDRMAYTLGLSAAILEDLYYINYDYICGVNDYLDEVALGYRYDDYMEVLYARDRALRRLLSERQWALLMTYDYFYRPITFVERRWSFGIYRIDHRMNHFFFAPPRRFDDYRGGRFFAGMRRIDGPAHPINGPVGGPVMDAGRGTDGPGYHIGEVRGGDVRTEAIRQGGLQGSTIRQGAVQGTVQNGNAGNVQGGAGYRIGDTPTQGRNFGTRSTVNAGTSVNNGNTAIRTTGTTATRTSATAGRNVSSTRTTSTTNTSVNRTVTPSVTTRTSSATTRTSSAATRTPSAATRTSSAATRSIGASTPTRTSSAATSTRSAGASSATRSVGGSTATRTSSTAGRR